MTDNCTTISINYSDEKLRILVEEYITQQRNAFTLQGVCSYVLYWAMEEGKATQSDNDLFDGDNICQTDCDRISKIMQTIASEGRIAVDGEHYIKSMN